MELNQLRFGNYVKGNVVYRERQYVTFERMRDGLEVAFFSDGSMHGIGEYLKDLSPIPLTEEWLFKFGFISNPYEDRYEKGLLHIECNKTRGVLEFWIERLPFSLTIKYVHSLQNLYFALTGEELTIKQD